MSAKWESHVAEGRIEVTFDGPGRNPPKEVYVRFRHPEGKKMTRCELNGKPYKNFDPEKEWVVLTKCPDKTVRVVAFFE